MPEQEKHSTSRAANSASLALTFIAIAAFTSFVFFCWSFLVPGVAFKVRHAIDRHQSTSVVIVEVRDALLAKPTKFTSFLKRNILPFSDRIVSTVPVPPDLQSTQIVEFKSSSTSLDARESGGVLLTPYVNPVGILEGVSLRGSDLKAVIKEASFSEGSNPGELVFIDFGINPGSIPVVRPSSTKLSTTLQKLVSGKVVLLTEVSQGGLSPAFRGSDWGRLVGSRDAVALLTETILRGRPIQGAGWVTNGALLIATMLLVTFLLRRRSGINLTKLSLIVATVIFLAKIIALGLFGERLSLSLLLLAGSATLLLWIRDLERHKGSLIDPELELALITERELAQEFRSYSGLDQFDCLKATVRGCFPNCMFLVGALETVRNGFDLVREQGDGVLGIDGHGFKSSEVVELLRLGVVTRLNEVTINKLFKSDAHHLRDQQSASEPGRVFLSPLYYRTKLHGVLIVVLNDAVGTVNTLSDETAVALLQQLTPQASAVVLSDGSIEEQVGFGTTTQDAAELLHLMASALELNTAPSVLSSANGWGLRYSYAMRVWLTDYLKFGTDSELPRSLTELLRALFTKDLAPVVTQLQGLIAQEIDQFSVPLPGSTVSQVVIKAISRTAIDGIYLAGVLVEVVGLPSSSKAVIDDSKLVA